MTQLAAVTPERHARKAWKSVSHYAFAAVDTVMPLVGAELSKAATAMPIGFIHDVENAGRRQTGQAGFRRHV